MPKEINRWAMYPRKTSTSPLPEALNMEVTTKANELIETVLKPKYIQPPPENPQFEAKFARMQYASNRRFHLSYMRYTGQWIQLYTDLTVDECIETIRDDPNFSL
jgi:hypothetical protein